ncbi:UNVERIFIED_ORG: hypothetical protein FHR68_001853 [Xanthomonas campestris]
MRRAFQQRLFVVHALQLPLTKRRKPRTDQHGQTPSQHRRVLARHDKRRKKACNAATTPTTTGAVVNDSLKTLLIVAFLIVILWNLGAGLYYLLTDRGETKRTVNALTWRIGLSVALIAVVILGIYTGWIKPHGLGR